FDRCAGGVLEIAADGQRCEHHGDVRFDRLALAMENRPGTQVALSHPEGCLYLPEIVVSGDDAGSVHGGDGQVVTSPFSPARCRCCSTRSQSTPLEAPSILTNRSFFIGRVPSAIFSARSTMALIDLSSCFCRLKDH